MNFLAHLALAHPEEPLMVGGFLGDFVKGVLVGMRPPMIEDGIRLHRSIDAFTNTDSTMRDSARYFAADIRRFVPILVDIIGDHFLAADFEAHVEEKLPAFAQRTYALLEQHRGLMPPAAERYRKRMTERNGLVRYRDRDTLSGAFAYVAERFRRPQLASDAMAGLTRHYHELRADFETYYPGLIAHVRSWRQQREVAVGVQ